MKKQNWLRTLQTQNIWQRPIRENDLLAIINEGGRMAAEFGVSISLLGYICAFSRETFGSFIALLIAAAIAGYLSGGICAFFYWVMVSFSGRLKYRTVYVVIAVLLPIIFPLCMFHSRINNFNPGTIGFIIYCLMLTFAGRFGAKVYDVAVGRRVS